MKKLLLSLVFISLSVSSFAQTGTHLNFDGVNDHIVLNNESNFDFTDQLTVEFWMKSATLPEQWDALVVKGDNSWRLALSSTGTVGFAGTPLFADIFSTTVVTDGNWHHVAATYDGSIARLYVDGTQENSVSASGNLNNSSSAVSIGENLERTGRLYTGDLDELRIWNVSRTVGQINDNMSCQLPYGGNRDGIGEIENGIVGYYTFNQGIADGSNSAINVLADSSETSVNNGTLNNFSLAGTTSNWSAANSSSVTGITFTSNVIQNSCDGQSVGSIAITPSGGVAPYSYQWSNGSTSNSLVNLPAGIYNLYGITDDAGCLLGGNVNEAIATFTVSNSTNITYTAAIDQISCNNQNDGSVTITPSGGRCSLYVLLEQWFFK